MNILEVKNLTKEYLVPKKKEELKGIKKRFPFLFREYEKLIAVNDINFSINKGEIVGYIGPNGAGKSTTIKMMTGILHPTNGEIKAFNNISPQKNRNNYTKNIGVIFGQRSSLNYDIPPIDSFEIFKSIYDLSNEFYNKRLKLLTQIMQAEDIIQRPYRMLSLGEKMKVELIACFLHKPKMVFLDEPTIGLDTTSKIRIREFLKEINQKEDVTIIITTHDMDDIEELCKRIILIDNGVVVYDGNLNLFRKKYVNSKQIQIFFKDIIDKKKFSNLKKKYKFEVEANTFSFELKTDLACFIKELMNCITLIDLNISEPKLEKIVAKVYSR